MEWYHKPEGQLEKCDNNSQVVVIDKTTVKVGLSNIMDV